MSGVREALLFLDLDKGGEAAGPLFEEPQRRLQQDPALRAQWSQYQALRALAYEAAPEPGERLIRLAMAECRRERVKQQLARAAGSEDLAREILLGHRSPDGRKGLPAWAWALALIGGLGAAWFLLGPQMQALLWPESSPQLQSEAPSFAAQSAEEAAEDAAMVFEFPVLTPPAASALAPPEAPIANAADVKKDPPAAQKARRLLREHLQAQAPAAPAPTSVPTTVERRPPPEKPTPPPTAVPTQAPTAAPTALPTAVPTAIPTAVPTVAPTAMPTAVPTQAAQAESGQADLSLSAPGARPGGKIVVTLQLPERRDVDLRLFDQRGRPIKSLHSGELGAGTVRLTLKADDEQGLALKPGTYYLRVMTPWFSRVEPIEIAP